MPNLIYSAEKMRSTKFHMLTPLDYEEDPSGKTNMRTWRCRCDCGGEVRLKQESITKKRYLNKSCGCVWKSRRTGADHPLFRGHGELSGKYLQMLRHGARHRGLPYLLTAKEAWEMYLRQGRRCAISGVPITMGKRSDGPDYHKYQTASLDRIDSSKGYYVENLQWVHKDLNYMKGDMTDEELVRWCRTIARHNGPEATADPVI